MTLDEPPAFQAALAAVADAEYERDLWAVAVGAGVLS